MSPIWNHSMNNDNILLESRDVHDTMILKKYPYIYTVCVMQSVPALVFISISLGPHSVRWKSKPSMNLPYPWRGASSGSCTSPSLAGVALSHKRDLINSSIIFHCSFGIISIPSFRGSPRLSPNSPSFSSKSLIFAAASASCTLAAQQTYGGFPTPTDCLPPSHSHPSAWVAPEDAMLSPTALAEINSIYLVNPTPVSCWLN